MPAFHPTKAYEIQKNIATLFRRLKMVSSKTISHGDFLSLFVPRAQRDAFRQMATLSDQGSGRRAHYKWGDVQLSFRVNEVPGKPPPPIPRYMTIQDDAPEDLIADITAWSLSGGDASGDFGRVSALFNKLNESLTKSQMRFVWPSIIAICNAEASNSVALAAGAELLEIRQSGAVPLPRGLLLACRKTAATIAMTSLIPHDVQVGEFGEVTIESLNGQNYDEPELGGFLGHT